MKAFKGYEAKSYGYQREQLPVGGYVGKIIGARVDENKDGSNVLILQLEIAEGQYKDFFKRDYDEAVKNDNGKFPPKYKGVFRIGVPVDNSEQWLKDRFGSAMYAVEQSNDGYHWEWEEKTLKNKLVGFLVRESEYNGNTFTEIGMLTDAQRIRDGKYKNMKKREERPQSTANSALAPGNMVEADDDELPF